MSAEPIRLRLIPRVVVESVHPNLAEALATFDVDPESFTYDELHRRMRDMQRHAVHTDGPELRAAEGEGYGGE